MKIKLSDIGKRYNRDWIVRHINLEFHTNKSYAILGTNGSGKSTLLKLLSGFILPTEGDITFEKNGKINSDEIYKEVALAAPYLDVYEEFTIPELYNFQAKFKPFSLDQKDFLAAVNLSASKRIKEFSSGMKQKLKLALALFADVSILLLDEPTINLDANAKVWYSDHVKSMRGDRLVIVSSNYEENEYDFVEELIQVDNFKPSA